MGKNRGHFIAAGTLHENRQQGKHGERQRRWALCLFALFMLLFGCLTAGAAAADEDHLQIVVDFACDEAYQQVVDGLTSGSSDSFYITIYQNGSWRKGMYLSAKDGWKADLTDCPLTDGNGKPYEYTFSIVGYKKTCFEESHSLENGVLTVKQTFRPTMDVTATIIFRNDDNDYYGRRPAADTITPESFLLVNDKYASVPLKTPYTDMTVNENGQYVATYKNVPTYYQSGDSYKAVSSPELEAPVISQTNYKLDGGNFNASTGEMTVYFAFVSKEIRYRNDVGVYLHGVQFLTSRSAFDYVKGFGVELPEALTVTLLENGQPIDRTDATVTSTGSSHEMPALNKAWHIPLYNEDGTEADLGTFTLEETPTLADGTLDKRFIQIEDRSTRLPSRSISTEIPTVYSHGLKITWDDNDNAMGTREAFPMQLLANGSVMEVSGTRAMPVKNGTNYLDYPWSRFPCKDADGNHVTYSVDPQVDKAYYACTSSSQQTGSSRYEKMETAIEMKLRTQKVTADVEWLADGSEAESKLRPGNVLLTLYTSADGGATWQEFFGTPTYAVSSGDKWHAEWDAPYCDAEGNPLMYKVEQNSLSLYETTYSAQYPDTITEGSETRLKVTNNYVIHWDFDVQLSWDTADATRKFHDEDETYQNAKISKLATLTINANQDYAAGDLSVRLPYQLFAYREHDALTKPNTCPQVECGLPMAPETNPAYAFNYAIDKHGSDDPADWEIVLTNWKDISSGYNMSTTLRYTIDPYYTTDCTVGTLKAVGTGKSKTQSESTTHETNSISYRLDTGIKPTRVTKSVVSMIYSGEEYDLQNYNYVRYSIYSDNVYYNQPFRIVLDEQPGENGEIVSVTGSSPKATYNEETGMWETELLGTKKNESYGTYSFFSWTVIVRYPRAEGADPENEGQMRADLMYHNNATMHYIAADEHEGDKEANDHLDVYDIPLSAEVNWKDYTFDYKGEIISGSKSMWRFNSSECGITALQYGQDVTRASITVAMTAYGYNLTDGYRFDFYDDAVYARAKQGGAWTDYVRLTENDYEMTAVAYSDGPKLQLTIKLTDVDRTNGDTIDGVVPTEPFTLWGRRGSGAWEKIADVTVTKPDSTIYVDGAPINGKGFTGMRLTSPDGLQGKVEAKLYFYMNLKGTSETLQALAAGDASEMEIVNISGHELYTPDEAGVYRWFNPLTKSSNQDAERTGLNAQDLQERGAYIYRRSETTNLYPAKFSSTITKTTGTITYDKTNSIAEVPFTISAYENVNTSTLPTEVYEQWSTDSGTFYDLLPLGYRFDTAKGVDVRVAGYNASRAVLESCTVVSDDYQGTGRQLLCFKLRSSGAPGQNYTKADYWGRGYSSGFTVTFNTSITYDDIALYGKGINLATYQRGDLREIAGGYADDGHGPFDQTVFPLGEDGEYVLKDVNGTGDLTTKNTLFASSPVLPEPLPTVQTGIRKTVRARSASFVQDDISGLGENYTYKVVIEASKDGFTSDIIMYDVLETARNGIGWKGEFASVDCRIAQQRGIDVKVYYSADDLNYSDEEKLSLYDQDGNLNAHWQLLTDDVPRADVKALALDMRYLTTGEPLVLDTQSMLFFEVTMKAPDQLQPVEFAYNQSAYFCKYQGKGSDTVYEKLTVGNVTSVNLRDLQDIVFRKVYDAEDGTKKPLGGACFSLYQCHNTEPDHRHTAYPSAGSSCWGTAIASTSSLGDGMVSFRDLDSGVYAVYESSTPSGYRNYYSRYWVFTVDAEKGTISDPVPYAPNGNTKPMEKINGEWTLTNDRPVRSFSVIKNWKDNQNQFNVRPQTLTFDLYRNGELYQTKTVTVSQHNAKDEFLKLFKDVLTYDEYGRSYIYQIRERIPDGYIEQNDGIADISTTGSDTRDTMINTRLGVLEVKKVLVGSDTVKTFGFVVTLKNADGTPYIPMDKEGNAVAIVAHRYTTDASVFTRETLMPDAQGCVRLNAAPGETLRLLGLPYGVTWTAEEEANGYTTASDPAPAAGIIGENVISMVTFTNTAKPAVLTLNVNKAIVGSATQGAGIPFTFEIAAVTAEAPLPTPATATVTGAGTVSFAPITFTHTGTYVYRVTETAGNAGGYQYDDTAYEVTVTVTDVDGQLTAAWTAKKGTETAEALTFTNTYSAAGSLTLTAAKQVNGNTPTDTQVFDFELASGAETPAVHQTKQNAGGNVTFDQINYTQADAGKTYTYTVKETTADGSGFTMDKTVYTVTVTITDNGDGTLAVVPTYSTGDETALAMIFHNTYEATGSLPLTAYKTVNAAAPSAQQIFSFELTSGANTPSVHQTKQNAGETVTFDPLQYTLADAGNAYVYFLEETSSDGQGYTMDKTVYTIRVRVEDNGDGTLKLTATASNGQNPVTLLTFDNTYEASGKLSLKALKTVNGKEPAEDQRYTFELASGANTPALNQIKENELGLVTFDDIAYTLADAGKTYQYTVRETAQDDGGLTVDKTIYTVTVDIADNGDGTLRVTPTYSNGTEAVPEIAFDNQLAGSIILSKKVEGRTTDEEFTFTITFTDEMGTALTGKFAYTGSRNGEIGSGETLTLKDGENVTFDGVPVGTICTVMEQGSFLYTTTVNDREAASIRFSVTPEAMPVAFVNTFITTEFTVTKEWQGGNGGVISLTLYANGEKLDPQPACTRNGDTYTYTGLPKYDAQGETIEYSAKERYMDGYMTIYKNVPPYESESSFIYDGGTIVNRAITEIAVRKVWTGMDETEARPEIKLTLYCNGQVIDKKPKLDKNGWYHFYNLPLREAPYYVVETPVDGYATSYENVGEYADETDRAYNGGTITNHKLPKTGDSQPLAFYGLLLVASLCGIVICRKKRQKN